MDEDFEENEWPFGAEGGAKDVLTPSGVGSTEVSKLLARAERHAGEYSFGGRADSLPIAPGLFVDGLGAISTPLTTEQAEKLVALCKKSPFGHNMDTKMDENVRKSWQLEPSLVQFQNPLWQSGIESLGIVIADRLGYQGVPLNFPLYKLLVYEEGGHFVKHQDTEKEDGMIATLVVQPPSLHDGGDLVVYQSGELKFRHDFGKSDGKAAFFPHYAVHYADAEHALEKVTNGYRLALVYSICLPPTMRHLERPHDQSLSESLANAIAKMEGDDDSFALLLTHEYTENSIRNLGWGALKGVDSARYHALDGANALVSKEKELIFFIAQLRHNVFYWSDDDDHDKQGNAGSITWYTAAGEMLGTAVNVREKVNFLNPSHETLEQLWDKYGEVTKEGGYTGNQGSTRITTYTRCAIMAWQKAKHPDKAMKLMSPEGAALALSSTGGLDGTLMRQLLKAAVSRIDSENKIQKYDYDIKKVKLSLEFFRLACEFLAKLQASDSDVVVLFFKKYCPHLGAVEGNEAFIPFLTKIVRAFDWSEIGEAMLASMEAQVNNYGGRDYPEGGLSPMEMALSVLDGLDEGAARETLLKMAVEKAVAMADTDLLALNSIGMLWKWVVRCKDKSISDVIVNKLSNADTSLVGPSIQYFSQFLSEIGTEKRDELAPIVVKRATWLDGQINALDKKFTWEMPDARLLVSRKKPTKKKKREIKVVDKIQAFLRGGEISMTTKGVKKFKELRDAQNFAARLRIGQDHCSFEVEVTAADSEVLVTITKTRDWFLTQQKKLMQYQTELRILK